MLEREVEKVLSFDRIAAIILTHQDIDHIGNLASIVKIVLPRKVMVLCHEEEKPFVEGRQAPHKLSLLDERAKDTPPERQAFLQSFVSAFASSYSAVDRTLSDGDDLPFCGGKKVVSLRSAEAS